MKILAAFTKHFVPFFGVYWMSLEHVCDWELSQIIATAFFGPTLVVTTCNMRFFRRQSIGFWFVSDQAAYVPGFPGSNCELGNAIKILYFGDSESMSTSQASSQGNTTNQARIERLETLRRMPLNDLKQATHTHTAANMHSVSSVEQ
ncbi:hypothetical protein PPTG_24277 [Phytophthora nicotianae INRA-310]|uniref:Uncharacterized protein n=1 Tax=Phytophthora nicotianae (strain INRA-310) TaxID=761204 RepID=W2PHI5_PHYN3|nr:hypothetical protein PPTG_24277 [Phytophthora nicotianae INRA-310]ETN00302.1 hypothetical protein PPTG_24277 [Phytophthora nicotianae INRA-310]